jgi:hypothetical protein
MYLIKLTIWLLLALSLVQVIMVAKVGRQARSRKGYGHGFVLFYPIALIPPIIWKDATDNQLRIRPP